jgi:hypothetical protein
MPDEMTKRIRAAAMQQMVKESIRDMRHDLFCALGLVATSMIMGSFTSAPGRMDWIIAGAAVVWIVVRFILGVSGLSVFEQQEDVIFGEGQPEFICPECRADLTRQHRRCPECGTEFDWGGV